MKPIGPMPAPVLSDRPRKTSLRERAERLRREEEARRMADLERRAAEERALQERRITSPTIAFGGTSGANETPLAERTFGEVTDFVLNGALPTSVTQAEVIANPFQHHHSRHDDPGRHGNRPRQLPARPDPCRCLRRCVQL